MRRNFVQVGFNREMSGIVGVDLHGWNILPEGLRSRLRVVGIVGAPDGEQWRLLLAQAGLCFRQIVSGLMALHLGQRRPQVARTVPRR